MLEDAEAMQKAHAASPRFRLWTAGFLIFAGTFALVETAWYPIAFRWDPRENTTWHTTSDRTYSGVLSATNQSVVIPLTGPSYLSELHLTSLRSNYTPITVTLRDWNASIVLQLVNYTTGVTDWHEIEVHGGLWSSWPDPATLTVARVSADVEFFLRIVIGYWMPALPSVPSFGVVILGNILGVALVGIGFGLIEGVVRDIRRGLL